MPLPKPNKDEAKDDFLSRCMGNDKMLSEYPNEKQRSAVCAAQFSNDFEQHDDKDKDKKKQGYTVEAEIFAVGTWNGMQFTAEDLMDFANSFHSLKEYHKVPLKMGHNDKQPFTDGQPALGWVVDVWYEKQNNKLMAKFEEVPEIVKNAIESGRYKHVSIEADFGVEHGNKFYSNVLSGVALLGADIPAVNTLADLQAYMSKEGESVKINFTKRQCFSFNKGVSEMPTVEELQAQLAQKDAALVKAESEKATFSKKAEDAEKELATLKEAAKKTEFARNKENFTSELDQLVKANKIAPAQRDKMVGDYSEENAQSMQYSLNILKDTVGKVVDDKERGENEADKGESSANPSEEVDKRATKYSRENKVGYVEAVQQVLADDNKLAREWADFNEA